MKTIWKYKLSPDNKIVMPRDAEVLSIQLQGASGVPYMWVLVNPDAETETRVFKIYGTGYDMPDNPGKHLGTVMTDGGAFVLHVFEDFFKIINTTKE